MHQPPENLKEKEYQQRLRKVLAYINENLSDDLSLEKLAGIASYSPFETICCFSFMIKMEK
jgi:AraC-like DNA-binding protein